MEAARHLIEHGVPVFLARPALEGAQWLPDGGHGKTGYWLPPNWHRTAPDLSVLDKWRPGDALAAVMGHGVDAVDVDPRNGGDRWAAAMAAAGCWPTNYGRQATPSGGWHELIASLRVRSRDDALPGIDVKAGDGYEGWGFLFIAPTLRRCKQTGQVTPYRWVSPPCLDELADDDSGDVLAARIRALRDTRQQDAPPDAPHQAYDAMSAAEQAGVRRWLEGAVVSVTRELNEAATWPEGQRDERQRGWQKLLADACNRFGRLVRADWTPWTQAQARETLCRIVPPEMATTVGFDLTWASQWKRRTAAPYPKDLGGRSLKLSGGLSQPGADPETGEVLGEGDEDFWTARPALQHIFQAALARRAGPWGVLGVVLIRVLGATPPTVQLPPIIGSRASLNSFIALVAESGGGKGAAVGTAKDAVRLPETYWTQPGSGEGLTRTFVHMEKSRDDGYRSVVDRVSAIFYAGEVDGLAALTNRRGATLGSALRSMWSAEGLGYQNADPTRNLHVAEHSYRAGLIVGVQPNRAKAMLAGSDGGTPQRFLWLPTGDPRISLDAPPWPGTLEVALPQWSLVEPCQELSIPLSVEREIAEAYVQRQRGEGDALDGHALLCREKVAAALCLLDGRKAVREEDWELATVVSQVSDRTRRAIADKLAQAEERANMARGRAEAMRSEAAREFADERAIQRVAQLLLTKVSTAGREGLPRGEARRATSHRDRPHFDAALQRLVVAGSVTVVPAASGERLYPTGVSR